MMPLLTRILKRLVVLLLGALVIYVAVWEVFPFFDNRTPVTLALLATYVVMAYFAIPALFRVIRLFYRPSHIPLYCITPDGFASDPLNVGLIGSRPQIIMAMEAAGWHMADAKSPTNTTRQIIAYILKQPYANAPVSSLYLFGRKQDLAFQKEISGATGHRHHVRFWATDVMTPLAFAKDVHFWKRFHARHHQMSERQFWIGASSKDIGLAPIRHNAQLTHMVHPDTNAERELIVHDLRRANKLAGVQKVRVNAPFKLRNRAWRAQLHSDGNLKICILK